MDRQQYKKFLNEVLLPPLLRMIAIHYHENPAMAVTKFYKSPLYETLRKGDMEYWQYSTGRLFTMFRHDADSGSLT